MRREVAVALSAIVLLMLLASAGWGAIGVYPRSNPGLCPATITYILNKDADMLAGETPDWSLKIEIVPAVGGAAVRTWRFVPTDPEAQKGTHSVTWNGMKDDGSSAPAADYYANITARATPVADDGNVHMLWEDNKGKYYTAGVNNNINSPLYGRIYVTQQTNGLVVYEPDGTYLGTWTGGVPGGWGTGSGPFGSSVDQNDNIWMSARSGTQARKAWLIKSDLSGTLYGPLSYAPYDRGAVAYGPSSDAKVLDSACLTTSTPGNGQLSWWSGDASAGGTATMTTWTDLENKWFQPAKLYYDTAAAKVRALVPYRSKANVAGSGGVVCYDIDWTGIADPTEIWQNNAYTLAVSCDISPDNKLWVARNTTEATAKIGVVSMANAPTAADFETKLGITGGSISTPWQMQLDGFGNLALTGNFTEAFVSYAGVYEPPESGAASIATITVPSPNGAGIRWDGDDSPAFVEGSFSVDPVCIGHTTRLTVTVTDNDNDCATSQNDIGSVKVTCDALGWTNVPMNYQSCSGKTRTYFLDGTVQSSAPAGETTAELVINDVHTTVTPGTGSVPFTVEGGLITGVVTNGETGTPVADVTVTATLGGDTFTGVTDSTGRYTLNVTPGLGYTVALATAGVYGTTTPAEYNLYSDWPDNTQGYDWPKTLDVAACTTSADQNGRVWPLAVTEVTYDWVSATHAYLPGNRTVSVIGTVMRQPEIASVPQAGFNGYYWVTDSRQSGTYQAVRVAFRDGDPLVKKGDNVVVTGPYDVTYGYSMGMITPASAESVVILSSGNELPTPRDLSYWQNNGSTACGGSAVIGNMIGGLYNIAAAPVTAVDTANGRYTVQIPTCITNSALNNVTVDLDTDASTGCPMPAVGNVVSVTGVLDQILLWDAADSNHRAIRPGEPSDQVVYPSVGCSGIYDLPDDTLVYMQAKRVTAVGAADGANGIPADWAYVEEADRSSGCAVHKANLVDSAKIGLGDQMTAYGLIKTLPTGEKYIDATGVTPMADGSIFPRPLDVVMMTSRSANDKTARGMFVDLVGKVEDPGGTETFILNDGGVPVKVYGGTIAKPATGTMIKVRGVVSTDGTNATLLLRDAKDMAEVDGLQIYPMPGYYQYFRDYLILGPFTDDTVTGTNQERADALMAIDFIDRANGGTGAVTEGSVQPRIGDSAGPSNPDIKWVRWDGSNDKVDFNRVFLPGGGFQEYSVAYAVAYIWASELVWYYPTAVTIGADDEFRAYVNGSQVVENNMLQGCSYAKYSVSGVMLNPGLNTLVYKVVNGGSGFGLVSSIIVDGSWMDPGGWGVGIPMPELGYLTNRP